MPTLRGLVESLLSFSEHRNVEIACMDVGQSEASREWLLSRGVMLAEPTTHLGIPAERMKPYERAFVVRPFLRDYFPGRDIYIWIDSDIWLQGWWVIDAYIKGALETGMAITHERERAYAFQGWLLAWFAKHMILGYGVLDGSWMLSRPHLNAGLFAMRADCEQWALWVHYYQKVLKKTGAFIPHDQFSINRLVHGGAFSRPRVKTTILPPRYNWICDRGPPMWNDAERALCEPYPPYRTIGAIHLAGPGKSKNYDVRRTGGGVFNARLLYGVSPPE